MRNEKRKFERELPGFLPRQGRGKEPLRGFLCLSLLLVLLFLCVDTPCGAAAREVYTLDAVLLDGVNGNAPELTLFLNDGGKGREVAVELSKDCRFTDEGNPTDFLNFVARYKGKIIAVDFVERNGNYSIVECIGRTLMAN